MKPLFANVIIDISHEKVDKTFQYLIPEELWSKVSTGIQVMIPFGSGNVLRKGYVVEVTNVAEFDITRMKEIAEVLPNCVTAESQLIELAWWMKEQYGSTMNQALKTVLPVKQKMKHKEQKQIICLLDEIQLEQVLGESEKKGYKARVRLLRAFLEKPSISYEDALRLIKITQSVLTPMIKQGWIEVQTTKIYRNPVDGMERGGNPRLSLNESQSLVVNRFLQDYQSGIRNTYLIHGITGSGKTEVYLQLMESVIHMRKQVIILIPEIALTYQTVMRFYERFGEQVSIINSRLSQGERFDQFERAKNGEIQIMIGPRSALFTPFPDLGLIIIDEEHEGAYKSETVPRYHAKDVARKLARMHDASVVLGSATPSIETYESARRGEYVLFQLQVRAKKNSQLAKVCVVDLREELKEGNKSIFSRELTVLIEDRLQKRQQVILFINRRGYANFVSCRSCGEAMKCPHCDVSLTYHSNGTMVCHYCNHTISMPKNCPVCGSGYIATFGIGTQKVETMAKERFPQARVLRMDLDTTSKKGGHEAILSAFAKREADILIGTQMIVKGHDFPNVTLVGVLAADLSLNTPDYRCGERTFQLLTQAAGRAGRDERAGDVVIQTYNPEHYSITTAATQDYDTFFHREMLYRKAMNYPPVSCLLTIQLSSANEGALIGTTEGLFVCLKEVSSRVHAQLIGPANASVYKVKNIYRKILYIKHEKYDILIEIQRQSDAWLKEKEDCCRAVLVQYDFS